jgi:hypothetical protein
MSYIHTGTCVRSCEKVKYLGKGTWVNTELMDLVDAGRIRMVSRSGTGRGLHSSTFRLNFSAFCGIEVHQGLFRGCLGGVRGF